MHPALITELDTRSPDITDQALGPTDHDGALAVRMFKRFADDGARLRAAGESVDGR